MHFIIIFAAIAVPNMFLIILKNLRDLIHFIRYNKSNSALSNCIDGITGEAHIAGMWGRHYEQLLNDNSKETYKITILNSFRNVLTHM